MRGTAAAGVFVVLAAVTARAEAPAPASRDLQAEIAWARATWPDDFQGVHFHAPLQKLRAWVAHGPIPVYLFTQDAACRAATLTPHGDPGTGNGGPQPLTARLVGPARIEDGRAIRDVTEVVVDRELSQEDGSAHEARDQDGHWRLVDSSGYGVPPTVYGALSSVDDRVARWGGQRLIIRPVCSGPVEWLACAGGGQRPCVRCETVSVMIVGPLALAGRSISHGDRPVTCHDPCPRYPESPSVARLLALSARADLWRPLNDPPATVPSLYRSRADCLREHPQADRAPPPAR